VIVGAGSFLSRYADENAEITGVGRLVIGSVLLAIATWLPELSVDIACIRQGNPDLAVGDLLGSSLMNLLILSVLDLTYQSRGKMFSRAASGHALGGAASIGLTAIVAIALLVERQTGGREWIGLSTGTMLVMPAYVLSVRMIFLDQRIAARATVPG
jgi:cation:H+ antiporter